MRPGVVSPAAMFVGVLPVLAWVARWEATAYWDIYIPDQKKAQYCESISWSRFHNTLCFSQLVGLPGLKLRVFLGIATGPVQYDFVDFILVAYTEGQGKFRLGEVAGACAYLA